MNRDEIKEFLQVRISTLKNKKVDGLTLSLKKKNSDVYEAIKLFTNYLPKNCPFIERIYHIINNLSKIECCPICNKSKKFRRFNSGYSQHCSPCCAYKDEKRNEKISNTKKEMNPEKKKELYQLISKKRIILWKRNWQKKSPEEKEKIWQKQRETWKNKDPEEIKIINNKIRNRMPQSKEQRIVKGKETKLLRYGNPYFNNVEKFKDTMSQKPPEFFIQMYEKHAISRIKNGLHHQFASYCGFYDGIYFQSRPELIFLIFCRDNDIKIERPKKIFHYFVNGEKHKYYPDFYLPEVDQYVEIKGRTDETDLTKWQQFPYKLDIYFEKTSRFKKLQKYVTDKYGKDYYKEYIKNV